MVGDRNDFVLEEKEAVDISRDILSAIRNGDNEQAAEIARRHADQALTHPRLTQLCLMAFGRVRDLTAADELVARIIENGTTSSVAGELAVRHLTDRGRPEEARRLGTRLADLVEGSRVRLAAETARAIIVAKGDLTTARSILEPHAEDGSGDTLYLRILHDVFVRLGQTELASQTNERLIGLSPAMGQARLRRAPPPAAIDDEDPPELVIDGTAPNRIAERISQSARSGKSQEAADLARRSLMVAMTSPTLARSCLMAFERVGDKTRATALVDGMIRAGTIFGEATAFAVRHLYRIGRGEEAYRLGTAAVAQSPVPDLRLSLETARAALRADESPDDALALLQPFAESAAKDVLFLKVYSEALLEAGQTKAAIETLEELVRLAPDLPSARNMLATARNGSTPSARPLWMVASMIGRAIGAGNHSEAVRIANEHFDHALELPRLTKLSLIAFTRGGDSDSARRLVERVLEAGTDDAAVATLVVTWLLDVDRASEGYAFAKKVVAAQAEPDLRLCLATARAAIADQNPPSHALAYLSRVQEIAGDDLPFLRHQGEILLAVGRFEQAVDVLRRAVELAPKSSNLRLLYARALKHAQHPAEACDEMREVVRLDPSIANRRYAVALMLQAGRDTEAKTLYDAMVGERALRLKPTFAEQLASLDERIPEVKIPQKRLDWAWGIVSRKLGKPPAADRAEWDRRAKWGHLLDHTILDWLECSIERAGEIYDYFEFNDAGAQTILEAADEGKGVILVSAHIGVMFAGPLGIHLLGRPYRWLSSTPRISSTRYADTLISTADLNETHVARRIVESLREGCLVTLAIDGAMSPNAPRMTWEGVQVTHSPFSAVLAYKIGVPTIFTAPYWKDGRLHFAVRRLPAAEEGETLATYAERWRHAFYDEVVDHFVRGPENLRLNGGLWRHV